MLSAGAFASLFMTGETRRVVFFIFFIFKEVLNG